MNRIIKISLFFMTLVIVGLIFTSQKKVYDYNQVKTNNLANTISSSATSGSANLKDSYMLQKSSLAGLECKNFDSRPYAIFLENDPIARPLSGISGADLVIEMPVYGSITRLLVFYQCNRPAEVGPIRSARYDFITLAKAFDAILVHFGGEKSALELLDKGIIDHIDGLDYDGVYFYRKQKLKPPHNAFTDFSLLDKVRDKFGYRISTVIKWQEKLLEVSQQEEAGALNDKTEKPREISINYGSGYDVSWVYDPATRNYLRLRDGTPEIDNINKEKVAVKNIIVLEVKSRLLDDQYNRVDVIGEGRLWYFVDNLKIEGSWYKKDFNSRLEFFDSEGKKLEIKPGTIWLEYIDQNSQLKYN